MQETAATIAADRRGRQIVFGVNRIGPAILHLRLTECAAGIPTLVAAHELPRHEVAAASRENVPLCVEAQNY